MMMFVGDIVRRQARINAKKVGLVDGEKEFTYKETNERLNRLAKALIGLGLRKGNKLAFLANKCHEDVEAYFATPKTGLIIVPINARFNTGEITYILNQSESDVIIYQTELDELLKNARPNLTATRYFIKIGDGKNDARSCEAFLSLDSPAELQMPVDIDDMGMIMYTSGAAGEAKGVMITQQNVLGGLLR